MGRFWATRPGNRTPRWHSQTTSTSDPETGLYEYRRRVPKEVSHLDRRAYAKKSLKTKDWSVAMERAARVDQALETYWAGLLKGDGENVSGTSRYEAALMLARSQGFTYQPIESMAASADLEEVVRRVLAAHGLIGQEPVVAAIMGTVEEPLPMLKDLWTLYAKYNKAGLQGQSDNQARKHRVPRERAIGYAVAQMGDKPLGAITRADVLKFRDWWIEKMAAENLKADSLNRCFSDIKGMISVVDEALHTEFGKAWEHTRIKATNKTKSGKRGVYSNEFIQGRLLAPGALDGMNLEARSAVLMMIETGMRPSEICNLRAEDILLDGDIPHVRVTERHDRRRKTDYSVRDVPLVGCALWAAKQVKGGFSRYADKEDLLSSTVNKFLGEAELRPTKQHTLYSLRHSFQDRILEAKALDRVQADLMGHAFTRESYGEGASLAAKLEVLEQIKFRWTSV